MNVDNQTTLHLRFRTLVGIFLSEVGEFIFEYVKFTVPQWKFTFNPSKLLVFCKRGRRSKSTRPISIWNLALKSDEDVHVLK
jgi:hypothetical protein